MVEGFPGNVVMATKMVTFFGVLVIMISEKPLKVS